MKLVFGADHGGFVLKEQLKVWAQGDGFEVEDMGATSLTPGDDYTPYAIAVARKISVVAATYQQQQVFGVLCCRSGGGVTIAANRFPGARAVDVTDEVSVRHARNDNAANIIALSGDWLDVEKAKQLLALFCATPFSNAERHVRRLQEIDAINLTDMSITSINL